MENHIRQRKKELRREILKKRDALPSFERAEKSALIENRLFSISAIQSASSVLFYVSFKSEVQTESIIKRALASAKTVSVPITDLKEKRLLLSRIENFDEDLIPGTWGILEPRPEKVRPVQYHEIDLVITPGAVFCEEGWRIGYGGGFYDRLLRESGKKAYALAFEIQIVENIPYDPDHDIAVDYIITEKRIIECKKKGLLADKAIVP